MATVKINDFSRDFDVFELRNARNYRDGLNAVSFALEEAKNEEDFVTAIEKQCYAVFAFIDLLFGEGTHKEIFGESVNLITCLTVYKSIVSQITEAIQTKE